MGWVVLLCPESDRVLPDNVLLVKVDGGVFWVGRDLAELCEVFFLGL